MLGTPTFPEVSLRWQNGKTFALRAENLSAQIIYILGATLDGHPLEKAWLRHEDLMAVGTLVLRMGSKPGTWPTGAAPPSPLSDEP